MKNFAKSYLAAGLCGVVAGIALTALGGVVSERTSTIEYCTSCHVHTDADRAWKLSSHNRNSSGTTTECAACHLPPKQQSAKYFYTKVRTGLKDLFSYWFKDKEKMDWISMGELEHAKKIVFKESCKSCHTYLFPEGISEDGIIAHLHYNENEQKDGLHCISCHLDAGHHDPNYSHKKLSSPPSVTSGIIYEDAARLTGFEDFLETIPGTSASISMKAIPSGRFLMGSPEDEPFRKDDEGPRKEVEVGAFFMAETEITWDQYWAFYGETMSEGRIEPEIIYELNSRENIDAVSGPTPPFGSPDQGWGMGSRPAITMTHYAAEMFCKWLSIKTGRSYRLPTEAEWEYAARGGSEGQYFFEGDARKFSSKGFLKNIFKPDTTVINSYAVYAMNSHGRTSEPSAVRPNAFGLRHMYGNVAEYCSDHYQGTGEWVVRGGNYADDAALLRSAARSHTRHDEWLRTDPQMPKSIWWYSDIKGIGFRVVCDIPEGIVTTADKNDNQ